MRLVDIVTVVCLVVRMPGHFRCTANIGYWMICEAKWSWLRRQSAGFEGGCRCRRQIDPACRFPVTQRDAHVIVAGRRMAAADGGSGKSLHLGQIRVGTNII